MPNLDFRLYKHSLILLLSGFVLVYIGNYCLVKNQLFAIQAIELVQSLMLLFSGAYTYYFAHRFDKGSDKRAFWLWTISWWLLLFGRGISWGRVYFPDVDKIYFRLISIVIIATPIITLFIPVIKREIKRRFISEPIPVWNTFLAFLYLFLSDIVEHDRVGRSLLFFIADQQDVVEELLELPCMFALLMVALYLQKNDLLTMNSNKAYPKSKLMHESHK